MKKAFLIILSILIVGFISYKLFKTNKEEGIVYSSTTSRNVKIKNIKRNDSVTKIDFKVESVLWKTNGFTVPSKLTYIQNSKTGDKFNLIRAEGIQLDSVYLDTIFENIRYTLVFPKIDASVETIDFISENFEVFDIELVPQKHNVIIPKELQGNWLKTDGSNEWVYGFFDNVIIYNNEFWKEFNIEKKGNAYVLTIKNEQKEYQIFIKKSKQNKLLIGESSDNLNLFSKEKTNKKDFQLKNDKEFSKDIFKEGVAIYKGYIKGYHPKMNWDVNIEVSDVITHNHFNYVFKIEEDGTFYAEIPLNYTQKVFARIGKLYNRSLSGWVDERVLLEPGKTTVQFIDLSEHNAPFLDFKSKIERLRKSLFMGDLSQINTELKKLEFIRYFDFFKVQDEILDMTPSDYKKYCLGVMKKEQDSLNAYLKNNKVSQQAKRIKKMEISLSATDEVLRYGLNRRSASTKKRREEKTDKDFNNKKKIKEEQEEKVTLEYFDFLNWDEINNPNALILGSDYSSLINDLRFNNQLIKFGFYNYIEILLKNLKKRGIALTKDEKVMLNGLLKCKTGKDFRKIISKKRSIWNSFKDKYDNIWNESIRENTSRISRKKRKELYGIPNGFAQEIILGQEKIDNIGQNYAPLDKWILKEIDSAISNKNIKDILLKYNSQKKLEFAENIENKDYFIHKIPQVENKDLFYAIVKEYKGKAILIDFWATWCGPCLSAIDRVKPFKEKLKNKNIEFVYITGTTSPLKTYEDVISGIKGHHYRLSNEQWVHLAKTFNIKAIPHYLFVDKEGNIIRDKIHAPFISGEFAKLIKEYL